MEPTIITASYRAPLTVQEVEYVMKLPKYPYTHLDRYIYVINLRGIRDKSAIPIEI